MMTDVDAVLAVVLLLVAVYAISVSAIAWRWRRHISVLNRKFGAAAGDRQQALQHQLALANQQAAHWRKAFRQLANHFDAFKEEVLLADAERFSNPTIDGVLKRIEEGVSTTAAEGGERSLEVAIKSFQAGDYQNAHDALLPFAETGNTRAQTLMAKLYFAGNGVEQNMDTYWYWTQRAADGGDRSAKAKLKQRKRTQDGQVIASVK